VRGRERAKEERDERGRSPVMGTEPRNSNRRGGELYLNEAVFLKK
jgi:hypothetical protein